MSFRIGFNDLVKLLETYGYEDSAKIIADYLDECIDYEFDLSYYLWNTLLFNVQCFDTKKEALEYIDDKLCVDEKDCKIYEGHFGVYLEW